eukprot:CAMPEP_0171998936 /NCGR_PEP_ID=MMETSP1041-20130122/1506_1 /TAXON_ID=464988 /ORGANISM="Hemiselmis andersenii, Strain CCMP439" /LENGTH=172 /DNA_ID=CAMNT_0012652351 /DNA_START=115 /DNA_END=634 /DNA_ORIENTATION=-
MDWLTKPFEPIFSCMEPQRDGDKADKGRVTLLCAALDCSGTGRGGPKSNKKVVAGRRGMPGVEANNDHTKAMSVDSNDSQDTALPGGVGVVFAAGPIGSGPVVKGIVPGGSADQVGWETSLGDKRGEYGQAASGGTCGKTNRPSGDNGNHGIREEGGGRQRDDALSDADASP